jgi:hypothetical protein
MWKALVHLRSHALHLPIHAGPLWRYWARLTQEIPLTLEVHPVALTAPIARSLLRIANMWWTTKLRMWPGPPRQVAAEPDTARRHRLRAAATAAPVGPDGLLAALRLQA